MGGYCPDNSVEIRGVEARATDQHTADLRHCKNRACVRCVYGSAVEDAYLPASGTSVRYEALADVRMHLLDLLETRRVTGSNRP